MKVVWPVIISVAILSHTLHAQSLESIIPITVAQNNLPDTGSFILTATDYSLWLGLPTKYASSIQIVDAGNPWPPRWFATAPVDTNIRKIKHRNIPVINAFDQNQEVIFANAILIKSDDGRVGMQEAVLMCNHKMQLIDTFYRPGREIDVHDFAINERGEKLYFLVCDTIVDMRNILGNTSDSLVSITYEKIEITNKIGQTIFTWNPIEKFGLSGIYKPYIYEKSIINNHTKLGWSHGNSLCWDKDGNILYSYKYIGVGKISRQDGHFMWRVDRNNQKPGADSDSLPIFLQHDLAIAGGRNDKNIYTVLSNGDSLHPYCAAYQFTVRDDNKDPHLRIIKRFVADSSIRQTGLGNYDVEESGKYLINYGVYIDDTIADHILFEYRDKDDKLLSQYTVMPHGFCYRVHKLNNWAPERPVIIEKKDVLYSGNSALEDTWYRLSGKDLKMATKVGTGSKFKPLESGYYCLVVKYGIGYAVSQVVKYTK